MYLYHATLQKSISQIRNKGLNARNAGDPKDSMIRLYYRKEDALAKFRSSNKDSKVVLLVINRNQLNPAYIFPDMHNGEQDFVGSTSIAYADRIDPSSIDIANFKDKRIDALSETHRLSDKYYYNRR